MCPEAQNDLPESFCTAVRHLISNRPREEGTDEYHHYICKLGYLHTPRPQYFARSAEKRLYQLKQEFCRHNRLHVV